MERVPSAVRSGRPVAAAQHLVPASVTRCTAYRLDSPTMLSLDIPVIYLGMTLAGHRISHGASYLYDWIAKPMVNRLIK